MALQLPNARVSTFARGVATYTNIAANISAPTPKDMAPVGGIIRHIILLDPATGDIKVGDDVQILSWGPFSLNFNTLYRVFSASPAGAFGLEVLRVVVGEKVLG